MLIYKYTSLSAELTGRLLVVYRIGMALEPDPSGFSHVLLCRSIRPALADCFGYWWLYVYFSYFFFFSNRLVFPLQFESIYDQQDVYILYYILLCILDCSAYGTKLESIFFFFFQSIQYGQTCRNRSVWPNTIYPIAFLYWEYDIRPYSTRSLPSQSDCNQSDGKPIHWWVNSDASPTLFFFLEEQQ